MDVLSGSECLSWLPRVTWKFSLAAVSAKSSIKSHWWSKKRGFSREQMTIWRQTPPPAVVSFDGYLVWVAPLVWSCHGLPLWFFGGSLSMNIACWRWKTVETREFFCGTTTWSCVRRQWTVRYDVFYGWWCDTSVLVLQSWVWVISLYSFWGHEVVDGRC